MYLPMAVTKHTQIDAAVAEAARELSPAVQYVRYEITQDWSGEWAIFFRVLLSDEASGERNLCDVATKVKWR
jgi:hypothetical protein